MTFEQAYILMKNGKKMTRPGWKGYWYIDSQTGRLTIHTKDDVEISNAENHKLIDLDLTINQTLAEDWEVYFTEEEKEEREKFHYHIGKALEDLLKKDDKDEEGEEK